MFLDQWICQIGCHFQTKSSDVMPDSTFVVFDLSSTMSAMSTKHFLFIDGIQRALCDQGSCLSRRTCHQTATNEAFPPQIITQNFHTFHVESQVNSPTLNESNSQWKTPLTSKKKQISIVLMFDLEDFQARLVNNWHFSPLKKEKPLQYLSFVFIESFL